jgi:hemerythrin
MKWETKFGTGIHNIDQQHRELAHIVTQYENVCAQDATSLREVRPLIMRTREFLQFHFSVEESLMRLLPYPEFDVHRAEHQNELEYIADIGRRILSGNARPSLAALIRRRVFAHIANGDRHFAQYALRIFGQRPAADGEDASSGTAIRQA